MNSRDIKDLHPALARRFEYLRDNWDYNDNKLILTSTYRSPEYQEELFNLYVNHNGPKAAPPGRSLHNYKPALAFDVAFIRPDKVADYSWPQYKELGRRAKKLGLEWGGDWSSPDGVHFQFPMRWQEAFFGVLPPKLKIGGTFSEQLDWMWWKLKNMLRVLNER